MKAPKAEITFRLYIATKDSMIGVVLTQVMDGREHIITYLSRCLIDAETRDPNIVANDLAQQASGFSANRGKLYVLEKLDGPVFGRCRVHESVLQFSKTGGSGFRNRRVQNFQKFEKFR
jgi:hypothetical protein